METLEIWDFLLKFDEFKNVGRKFEELRGSLTVCIKNRLFDLEKCYF